MKPTTEIILGIRSVGDKSAPHIIESMTMIEAIKRIALWTSESTMHQRFQFVLSRTPEDALVGLGLSQKVKNMKRVDTAKQIAGVLDDIFGVDAPAHLPVSNPPDHTEVKPVELFAKSVKHPLSGLPMAKSGGSES